MKASLANYGSRHCIQLLPFHQAIGQNIHLSRIKSMNAMADWENKLTVAQRKREKAISI